MNPEDERLHYNWSAFVIYCEDKGISMDPGDYEMWWDCWKAGYLACFMEDKS